MMYYKKHSENVIGFHLTNFRFDHAGENTSRIVQNFCRNFRIKLKLTPPCAPQSNGVAEKNMQELGMRASVLLFGLQLPEKLCAEAMHHGDWLRNRLPSKRIGGNLSILAWKQDKRVSYAEV